MVSAYPGLFYPGQVYPGQLDDTTPPPVDTPDETDWGSFVSAHDGTWIRRKTRVLVWGTTAPPSWDVLDASGGTDIIDASTGTDLIDGLWPPAANLAIYDGNGSTEILDGGGALTSIYDGNG